MHELANRSVDLRDVLGRAGRRAGGTVAEAPDWADRFALVDRALGARLAAAPPADPGWPGRSSGSRGAAGRRRSATSRASSAGAIAA